MTDDATEEPSRDEILDNSPEAVAMRRMRAARAEARAREAAEAERPAEPGSLRRKLLVGAVLGAATAARFFARGAGRRGP